ncbi:MAG: hypothetical protein NT126_05725, partial [Bacteroidetes bacterium]|nr:hypothetical protein [Bacteroidota bacterium]
MYERAKYFSGKFIRNGIAGFFLSGIFLFSFSKNKPLVPVVFVFLVAATVWLYFGMLINKKLK